MGILLGGKFTDWSERMIPHYAKSAVFSLTAVARDPSTVFVCWDASAFGSDLLNGKIGANVRAIAGWCLRVAPQDGDPVDYVITPETGKYYVNGLRPGGVYWISIMLQDTVREKHRVCACGPLATPVAAVSEEEMRGWEISKETLAALCGGEGGLASSGQF